MNQADRLMYGECIDFVDEASLLSNCLNANEYINDVEEFGLRDVEA